GKTHLMRAFRNYAHGGERGYCGYLQMTSQASNYSRYVLAKLLDALDQPYCPPAVEASALERLSPALLEAVPGPSPPGRERVGDGEVRDVPGTVADYADRLLGDGRFAGLDLDVLRAVLFLQRHDPRARLRVLKWLRCEDMAAPDRAVLGGLLVPRPAEEAPRE